MIGTVVVWGIFLHVTLCCKKDILPKLFKLWAVKNFQWITSGLNFT